MGKTPKKQPPVSLRRAIALVREQTQVHKYCLVYWPEEESVTAVSTDAIAQPSAHELEVGVDCEVSIGRRTHKGKIAARGSKSEMESLERQFVSGEWTPSIMPAGTPLGSHNMATEQPPAKRPKCAKRGKENQQSAATTASGKTKQPGKQAQRSGSKSAKKRKENEQGATKSSKANTKPKGAILRVTQHGGVSDSPGGVSEASVAGSGGDPVSMPSSPAVEPVSVSSGSSVELVSDSSGSGVEPVSVPSRPGVEPAPVLSCPAVESASSGSGIEPVSAPSGIGCEDHAPDLNLSESDPLHLEMTVHCLQDTIEKLQSNQDSILVRLRAVETLIREQNFANKKQLSSKATFQIPPASPPRYPSSSSPEYSPLGSSPEYSPLGPPLGSFPEYSPSPPPLPPPMPPLSNSFTLGQSYHNFNSGNSLQPQLWYNQPYSPCSPFLGRSPPQYPTSTPSSFQSHQSLPIQQTYPTHQSYPAPPSYQQPPTVTSSQPPSYGQPPRCLPVKSRTKNTTLSSSVIAKDKLNDPDAVIARYKNYRTVSKAPTLATKLAGQAYFGDRVLKKCTVLGYREQPALPITELNDLKQKVFSMFPQFWANPVDFETTWAACSEAIGQCCKRLRNNP